MEQNALDQTLPSVGDEACRLAELRRIALDAISDFAYVFDLAGRFTFVNKPLLDLWGLTLEQAAGKNFHDLQYPEPLATKLQQQIQQVIDKKERIADETPYTSPTGVAGYYHYILTPVIGENGAVIAVAGSTRDISEHRRADAALQQHREQMEIVVKESNVGIWYCPLPFDKLVWDANVKAHFHLPPEAEVTIDTFYARLHPEDRQRTRETIDASIAQHRPYDIDYRTVSADGSQIKWIRASGRGFYDSLGNPLRFDGITIDMTERKQLAEERERLLEAERLARAEAESANQAKDRFLAVLSHELRTPLSPVALTIPLIERDPELPAKFRDQLAMVRRNIALEVKLIDDLLDLSRITSGKLRLQMHQTRAHDVLRHAIENTLNDGADKRIRLREQLEASDDLLLADAARLQQVFWNLLRNAVKFTNDGGEITVRTSNGGDARQLRIEISDTGIGIEPVLLPKIFDAFEQGDARITRQFGGLGLGLAIAKAVVEAHGGSIAASSEGRDRGTTFVIQLQTVSESRHTDEARPIAVAASKSSGARSKVLLVEDHPDTSRATAMLLTHAGFDVKTAHSVAAAMEHADAERFDAIVSDIGLPDATGYDLMRQVRERYGLRGIALSGYGMEEDVRRSRDAGFSEHLVKPIDIEHLERALRRIIDTPAA